MEYGKVMTKKGKKILETKDIEMEIPVYFEEFINIKDVIRIVGIFEEVSQIAIDNGGPVFIQTPQDNELKEGTGPSVTISLARYLVSKLSQIR